LHREIQIRSFAGRVNQRKLVAVEITFMNTISLVLLSEFAIADSPEIAFARLAEHGCVVTPPTEAWRPLSGGLEYNHYLVEPVTVDEIISGLIIEITRAHEKAWLNGFELRPWDASHKDWLNRIRVVLARDFESEAANESGFEKFTRGGTQALLVPESATESARLLLHRRLEVDGPA
jgi:hypothetical protein